MRKFPFVTRLHRSAMTILAIALALVAGACASRPSTSGGTEPVSQTSAPTVERSTVTETVEIPFERVTRDDPSLASGKQVVSVQGVMGTKTLTYEATYVNGLLTEKRLISEVITKAPVAEVTLVGTKPKSNPGSNCDPNYSGACVPIASDVDCEGGGGNGPAYVRGPVYVIGTDIYKLDADHDGIGCE